MKPSREIKRRNPVAKHMHRYNRAGRQPDARKEASRKACRGRVQV